MELTEKPSVKPSSDSKSVDQRHSSKENFANEKGASIEELQRDHPPTSYLDTLMHLFKGNVGSGAFGMADAIKNSGIVVGGILTIVIACICVHMQHILIDAAEYQKREGDLEKRPDYAETLEMCFTKSRSEKIRRLAPFMRQSCNFMICLTQLGFCSVFLVFATSNLKDILDYYGIFIDIHILMVYVFLPVCATALIRQLKLMAIFSSFANFCMITGIVLTIGFASQDLPPISERVYSASYNKLPFFFGIALFAFEGIALVLPLKNAMKNPEQFGSSFGVLNVGMFLITLCYFSLGEIGYWKYGEDTKGSMTLNLPTENIFAQVVKVMIAIGVLLGYTLELYVAVQIMFTKILKSSRFARKHPNISEQTFRSLLAVGTLIVAELVPNLTLLLSLIGAVFCSLLAFFYPVFIQLVTLHSMETKIGWMTWIKNILIILFTLTGCISGAYVTLKEIYEQF